MTALAPQLSRPPSKRMYVLWGVALALLLALGFFCWLVVVPVMQTRAAVMRYYEVAFAPGVTTEDYKLPLARTEMESLGGQAAAARKLATYLHLPRSLVTRRAVAAHLIGHCGRPAIPALIELLKDEDAEVRYFATCALARTRDKQAVEPLRAVLNDPDILVRGAAAEALKKIRGEVKE